MTKSSISRFSFLFLFSLLTLGWIGCGDSNNGGGGGDPLDQFDRGLMLTHWVDGFIIPGYEDYLNGVTSLRNRTEEFIAEPNTNTLNNLQNAFRFTYIEWQEVSPFEIGKAEEIRLRNQTNSFPTHLDLITGNISTGNYNLELPSTINQQGLPAIEYLIYGLADNNTAIVDFYLDDDALSQNRRQFLMDLSDRLFSMTTEVLDDWKSGFRESFINDDESVNRLVNDFLFYYERNLRAGKIGIPAGQFSINPLPDHVESLYVPTPNLSKTQFSIALEFVKRFFEGRSSVLGEGPSLAAYLDYIKDLTDGEEIKQAIVDGLQNAQIKGANLDNNFRDQVINDNVKMLETYDALQSVTILMKVDMLSALNIQIDYVDADGD